MIFFLQFLTLKSFDAQTSGTQTPPSPPPAIPIPKHFIFTFTKWYFHLTFKYMTTLNTLHISQIFTFFKSGYKKRQGVPKFLTITSKTSSETCTGWFMSSVASFLEYFKNTKQLLWNSINLEWYSLKRLVDVVKFWTTKKQI